MRAGGWVEDVEDGGTWCLLMQKKSHAEARGASEAGRPEGDRTLGGRFEVDQDEPTLLTRHLAGKVQASQCAVREGSGRGEGAVGAYRWLDEVPRGQRACSPSRYLRRGASPSSLRKRSPQAY
jgi:hypothetical protein